MLFFRSIINFWIIFLADPLIRKHLEEESPVDSVLIEVPVGTREE